MIGEEAQLVYEALLQSHLNQCETFNPIITNEMQVAGRERKKEKE